MINKLILTKSSLNTYWECEKRYQFVYRDYLVTKRKADYFITGDLVHLGLASGYVYGNLDDVEIYLLDRILEETNIGAMSDKHQDILSKALSMVRNYFNHYGFEPDVHLVEDFRPEVLIGEMDSLKVYYSGRLDAMKGNYILEHKTMGAFNSNTIRSLHRNPQTIGYKILRPDADGAIFNLLNKAENPKKKFHREKVLIPDVYVRYYKQFLMRSAVRMLPVLEGLTEPDRNLFACETTISGECAYRPICFIEDPELLKRLTTSYFNKLEMPPDQRGYDKYLGRMKK